MMKVFTIRCLLLLAPYFACAQSKVINYTESSEDFTNPERGFYIPSGTKASHFNLLDAKQLMIYRDNPQKVGKATYQVKVSLLYRGYELDTFKSRPLSDTFLTNLQKDLNAVREAGLKMIIRFAYTNSAKSGACQDEYKICPPYGDAPREIVLHHIQQLKPILQKNADVIAVMQEGFIGIWGENYFTDYFGDASTNGAGTIADSAWLSRNELLKALLDALPVSRMVQVRTPQIKQRFVYGSSALPNSAPVQLDAAFNKSYPSRVGFHNDCFLSSPDDYGTFNDYGNSTHKRDTATVRMRSYFKADSRYCAVGGETCDDAFSPQNDCAPGGHAEEEMRSMHYSFLNASYNQDVINDWDSVGCMQSIKRKLGYRLVLRKAVLPAVSGKRASFKFQLLIENIGYASPYNPRSAKVIFRNKRSKKEYAVTLKANPQFWFSGLHSINEAIKIPSGITLGFYELYLALPDESTALSKRPEYSIQLANENSWEKATGYNSFHHIVQIK